MRAERQGYRRFHGTRTARFPHVLALLFAGLRTGFRKKLPLLLLYALPIVWGVVFSFNVYMKYAVESGSELALPAGMRRGLMRMAANRIEVSEQLDAFFSVSRIFAVLVIGWFGAGLFAEDRRHGAHLLLFSRPLSRWSYAFARFLTVLVFGFIATLLPGMLICSTATFNSPDFEFLEKEGHLVTGTLVYCVVSVVSMALLVLAISSLATRKSFALAGVFGVIVIPDALGRVLHALLKDDDWRLLSPLTAYRSLSWWLLDRPPFFVWPVERTFFWLGALAVVSIGIIVFRLRRFEVDA